MTTPSTTDQNSELINSFAVKVTDGRLQAKWTWRTDQLIDQLIKSVKLSYRDLTGQSTVPIEYSMRNASANSFTLPNLNLASSYEVCLQIARKPLTDSTVSPPNNTVNLSDEQQLCRRVDPTASDPKVWLYCLVGILLALLLAIAGYALAKQRQLRVKRIKQQGFVPPTTTTAAGGGGSVSGLSANTGQVNNNVLPVDANSSKVCPKHQSSTGQTRHHHHHHHHKHHHQCIGQANRSSDQVPGKSDKKSSIAGDRKSTTASLQSDDRKGLISSVRADKQSDPVKRNVSFVDECTSLQHVDSLSSESKRRSEAKIEDGEEVVKTFVDLPPTVTAATEKNEQVENQSTQPSVDNSNYTYSSDVNYTKLNSPNLCETESISGIDQQSKTTTTKPAGGTIQLVDSFKLIDSSDESSREEQRKESFSQSFPSPAIPPSDTELGHDNGREDGDDEKGSTEPTNRSDSTLFYTQLVETL